ncbi:uncharacterized protein BcabD6B2_23410 [Babesia caballi]|uniref:Uncharacterized protein n=1 Tax=Babesia caballi TaxID=5871 RepID=A0AAV4LUY6_BABCB|nr:hypothetical protein BcabD6B2_23410 [Babesia caballi]
MACHIDIREPTTLKEALALFDVMDKSVGGSKQGVKTVFDNKLGSENIAAFNNFQSALENASNLRARIVSYRRVSNYGSYGQLKNYGNDEACGLVIVATLKSLLPKLIQTLEFLLTHVDHIEQGYWGGQKCNGGSFYGAYYASRYEGVELQNWLIDQSHVNNSFRRGYERHELSSNTGDTLKAYLKKLVKPGQNSLGKLLASITPIATYGIQVSSSPTPPSHAVNSRGFNRGSGGYGQYGLNSQPSGQTLSSQHPPPTPPPPPALPQGPPQTHQGRSHPPPAIQPSPAGGDSSTAAIGGAVGATGLVGGGAAVYFLNIGGIRTLIAG